MERVHIVGIVAAYENLLARIWWWPPEDGSLCDPKHVGVKEFYVILMCFFNKYVHELVTINNDFIDARFNYTTENKEITGSHMTTFDISTQQKISVTLLKEFNFILQGGSNMTRTDCL